MSSSSPVLSLLLYTPSEYSGLLDAAKNDNGEEDLNYSFLAKLFSTLSDKQKEKILQILKNTRSLEKTG